MNVYRSWRTLREIDDAAGLAKGSAFRAFKRLAPQWREGADYRVLDHREDAVAIAALRDGGRIHASSINIVLLSESCADALLASLVTDL
ncbi:MAG: hypothetical protein ACREVL_09425 [Solimonas sp.]